MKFKRLILLAAALAVVCGGTAAQNRSDSNRKPVDFKSKRTFPVPVGDSTAYALVGDVVLYHNGSVITCDSMIRYNGRHMTCFGNVIINKDETYIYGNKAEYNGTRNEARVYAPLIKVLDKDATLYTYNFIFNTKTNIGEYFGGGTFTKGENTLESEKGFYNGDKDELIGVDRVEVKNDTYQMKSDSVNYNTETEVARYFTPSVLWNKDGEILSSDDGEYHNKDERYIFRSNAYVLSKNQEMWADTIDYKSLIKFIELRHNAQIRDDEHDSIVFGDYGNYDDNTGDTFLTDNPSLLTIDTQNNDTVYMRSDSMFLYQVDSLGYCTLTRPDSAALAAAALNTAEVTEEEMIMPEKRTPVQTDNLNQVTDSLPNAADSMAVASAADSLASKAIIDSLPNQTTDSLVLAGVADTLSVQTADSLAMPRRTDSLSQAFVERLPVDSLSATADSLAMPADSLQTDTAVVDNRSNRVMLGLRNVKLFRKDFQGVCDSIIMFSADSTAQLHRNTIMWNELNQITGERADVYTKNQKPDRMLFSGAPLMSSEVDTTRYDQVAGKTIESLFADGIMYRTNVVGNARTYYYMVDDADGAIMGFLVAESADMSFNIDDNKVVGIVYRVDPVYSIYPMDQIPADQPQRLPDFVWYIERKPTREQILLGRTINPSEREKYEAMSKPQFPITYSIERYKESLISGGTWADRTDGISPEAMEFVEKVAGR